MSFSSRMTGELGARHSRGPLSRIKAHIAALPPGDRFIAGALAVFVVFASLYALSGVRDLVMVTVPSYGGSLTEGIVGSPRFVNPLLALSDADRDVTALVYAGLMRENSDGELIPAIAESYEVSPDGLTYTFTLRPGTTFSDGTPVTADDVAFTVEKAKDPALKSPEFANWAGVTATAVAPDTVEFVLEKPYASFLENATLGILPKHLWEEEAPEQFPFSPLMTMPVGAGPFVIDSVSRNTKTGIIESYELSAFDDYALGRPYLDRIRLVFFAETGDLLSALSRGSIDSAYGARTETALSASYSRVFGVFWNASANPLFARKEVREALSRTIDREKIAGSTLGGFASPLAGPVPPGSGIETTPIPDATSAITDATATLEEAGWEYDIDARAWKHAEEGLTLAVTLKTSNVPELKAVASQVKTDWERLGVPVTIELYEPGDLSQNVIRPRRYEALLFGMVIGRDHDLYPFWDSAERNDPGLNISLYANARVDELVERMRTSFDEEARRADLQTVNDLIAADFPAAFVYAPEFLYAVPEGLRGIELPQITSPSDRFSSVRNWYRYTEKVWPLLSE
ncbi:MAG: peptide ABC transporter substrate-binding protein [Candidatus Pacebacteria bacterium]|nr:peptide ABC transporter substrate-binding protein [Candidatus Paceibacterota bacterium]MBP9840342.1 peptide ABC transporter substrate-binding protein [Candidatus Paceibacterota bacterium]